jgi:hypothetical protein
MARVCTAAHSHFSAVPQTLNRALGTRIGKEERVRWTVRCAHVPHTSGTACRSRNGKWKLWQRECDEAV